MTDRILPSDHVDRQGYDKADGTEVPAPVDVPAAPKSDDAPNSDATEAPEPFEAPESDR